LSKEKEPKVPKKKKIKGETDQDFFLYNSSQDEAEVFEMLGLDSKRESAYDSYNETY